LISRWNDFLGESEKSGFPADDVNMPLLREAISMVHKMKAYYFYFHDIDEDGISEFRQVALLCYWIVKFKPFRMKDSYADLYLMANEVFALHLIFSCLERALGRSFRMPDEKFVSDFLHSLQVHDVCKEAMIDFVESFAVSFAG
jgi:hypothetical protein